MGSIDPSQLTAWFDAYGAQLVFYARQWLEANLAEDVVQDVFVRLTALRRPPDNPKGWLFRSVRNAAVSHLRSRRRRERRERARAERTPAMFEPDLAALIDADDAAKALETLPQALREVVALRIWAQMTLREVAETTGQPISTAFSRYRAGLEEIRRRMVKTCKTKKT